LEQEFNSLDAQREAGEAYIESQKLQGWKAIPYRYPAKTCFRKISISPLHPAVVPV
jgi:hypothetical protein